MATATVEISLPGLTGFTLSLKLYAYESDTVAATIATTTEATNRKGTYTGTTTAALTGLHFIQALEGANVRGSGYVVMSDTATVHVVQGSPADAMSGVIIPAAAGAEMDLIDAPNATAVTAIQSGLATPTNITAGTIDNVKRQGYEGPLGPGIYLNDNAANTNTTLDTDGTKDNPVSTIAAATTLATALFGANGGGRIYLVNSDIVLAQTYNDFEFVGLGALTACLLSGGSQDVDRTKFIGLTLYGAFAGSAQMEVVNCNLSNPTGIRGTIIDSRIGNLTIKDAQATHFVNCYGPNTPSTTPFTLTFGGTTATAQFTGGSCNVDVRSMTGSGNTLIISGEHQLTIHSTCTAGTVHRNGDVELVSDAGTGQTKTTGIIGDWADGERLDLLLDAIKVVTDAQAADGSGLTAIPELTSALTEAYGTDGSALTIAQLLYLILAHVGEHANAGTTKTLKKLDGSTTAATYTYDDATNPTSITRAT